MIKRIISLLCAAILLLGLFAACAKQSADTSASGRDTGTATLRDYSAWEGEWSRIDTGANTADITITNAKAGMFDFSFLGMYANPYGSVHVGDLEGTAHFTGENQALFEYEDEYGGGTVLFGFVLHGGKLLVHASENTLFGVNVAIDGVYGKRKDALL